MSALGYLVIVLAAAAADGAVLSVVLWRLNLRLLAEAKRGQYTTVTHYGTVASPALTAEQWDDVVRLYGHKRHAS